MSALVGGKGAGKTSTVMALATSLNPSSDTAWVLGYDVSRDGDRVSEHIGTVRQEISLNIYMTGTGNPGFHVALRRLPTGRIASAPFCHAISGRARDGQEGGTDAFLSVLTGS